MTKIRGSVNSFILFVTTTLKPVNSENFVAMIEFFRPLQTVSSAGGAIGEFKVGSVV
jgi:hypothetical protein